MSDSGQERGAAALDGARILLLTTDPIGAEELASLLEDAGAELRIPFETPTRRQVEASNLLIVEPRYRAGEAEVESLLAAARARGVPTLELPEDAAPQDVLAFAISSIRVAPAEAPVEETAPPVDEALTEPAGAEVETGDGDVAPAEPVPQPVWDTRRLLRAVVTVMVVVAALTLVFRGGGFLSDRPDPPPLVGTLEQGVPGAQTAGTAELGGRVTRSDTQGSVGGATVVVSGPSGPMATVTDGQGRWRFTGLRGGTYVVMSTVPRFVAKQVQVDVPEGRAVENVHLSLDPEGP